MDLIDLQINRFYNQIYQSGEENISTNVLFKDETFWMTQNDKLLLKQHKYIYTQKPAAPMFCWLSGL